MRTNADKKSCLLTPMIITESIKATQLEENTMNNNRSQSNITDQMAVTDCNFLTYNNVKSRIDHLTIQIRPKNKVEYEYGKELITNWLQSIGIYITSIEADLRYFDNGYLLRPIDKVENSCGSIKWYDNEETLQIELTGKGCNYFNTHSDYLHIFNRITESIEIIIKRLDIAVDTLEPKHGIRFVQQAFSQGLFYPHVGKKPERENISSSSGRSITIGSKESHKQYIAYEKGKQQGYEKDSVENKYWVRHEVRLRGRKGQTVPLDALFNIDKYFVGAFPKALQRIIKGAKPRVIKREVIKIVDKSLSEKLVYAKHQVGKTIYGAVQRGLSSEKIVQMTIRKGKKDNICYPSYISEKDLNNYMFE
jgi:DNA relaxase NicK